MKAIVLPRAAGKTQRMLNWLVINKKHVLVVMSVRERDRLANLLAKEGADQEEINRIIAISEILNGATRGRWHGAIYGVDELDGVLQTLFSGPVEVVAFTGAIESSTDPVGPMFPR
jgi:hypothetical protein